MPERVEGAQTPFEVYCYRCRVTFPVGTRRCLHCGGRLGQRGEIPLRSPFSLPSRPGEVPPDADEELGAAALRRFGGLALWAVLVLGALLSNLCSR